MTGIFSIRGFRMAVVAATLAGLLACAPRAAVAVDLKNETSLGFAPSDVAFYLAGMRLREVFDKVVGSKAYAKLMSIPSVQMGMAMVKQQWDNPENENVAQIKQFLTDPANQQLVELLKDGVSQEVFVYGDRGIGDLIALINDINAASSAGQMEAIAAGEFDQIQAYQTRKILAVLDQQGDRLKVPTLVEGFRLTDSQRALDELQRLETLATGMLAQQPALQSRLTREQIGGGEFLTLKLDGTLIPWPLLLQDAGALSDADKQKITEKLTALELVISLGVKDSYLLIAIGADNAHLGTLGQGELLLDSPRMAPIRDAADKPITDIAYVSGDFVKQVAAIDRQMDQVVTMVKQFAPMVMATAPELQKELIADVEKFAEYVKQSVPEQGDYSAFNYLTPEGYESFSYNWASEFALDASQELTILDHVGGTPIAFYAARGKSDPEDFDAIATALSRLAYYGEQMAAQQLDDDQLATYDRLKADMLPLVQRLGAATRDKLVPAFADGQSALVLDAKSESSAWHAYMPPPASGKLPMLEFAMVMGVSDAKLVEEGFGEYFQVAQDAIDRLHEASTGDLADAFPQPIPALKLRKPESKDISGGTVYYYALPAQTGLDKQVAPNAGLTDQVMVSSLLPRFTARLMAGTPLEGSGPLADGNRPLAAAYQFHFARLLDAIDPWVDYGMMLSGQDMEQTPMGNIKQQVHDVLDVLKCFRGVSSVTYLEGEALVSHAQWRFEDLQ
jgi:hypothetical protein